MKITKQDILSVKHIDAVGFENIKSLNINGVSTDTRKVVQDNLFIPLRGDKYDGHDFISKAIELGASCVFVEKRWAEINSAMMVSLCIPILIVENTSLAYGDLANIYRKKFDIPVIAVAGSNGKTTTKEMIRSVLENKYNVLFTEGNLNNHIGVPYNILRLNKNHDVAVIEIGTNHPGEIDYLCSILEPTHGLITNIGFEHMEFFKSLDGVAKAESELFEYLAKNKGTAFINADDKFINSLPILKKIKKKIRFGFNSRNLDYKAKILKYNDDGKSVLSIKKNGKQNFNFTVGIAGEHNAKNALAAFSVGATLKIGTSKIVKSLENFEAANKRMQIINTSGVVLINDTYNANPDSVIAALSTLNKINCSGKKIAVLADMLELGNQSQQYHKNIGLELKNNGINILFTYGNLSQNINEGAQLKEKYHFENKSSLIEVLLNTINQNDVVLVKGSRGMKMEEVVEAILNKFSKQ